MVLHLELVVILILLPSLAEAVVAADCQTKCGNVSIPYPFGIGNDCYLDSSYAIDCKIDKPFLKINNSLEVVKIYPENSTMVVNYPTRDTSCIKNIGDETLWFNGVNLSGSPFFYSETENVLSGLGCDNLVRIYVDGTIAGCYSSCADDKKKVSTVNSKGCFGTECCQTLIPTPLQIFETGVSEISGKGNGKMHCKRAILVQGKWLTDNLWNLTHFADKFTRVPVVLGWGILPQFNYSHLSGLSSCSNVSVPTFTDENDTRPDLVIKQCSCRSGYGGNAYLRSGCEDIDECQDKHICPRGMQCRNLSGSHTCSSQISIIGIVVGVIGFLLLIIGGWRGYIILKKRKYKKLKENYFKSLLLQQQLTSSDGNVDSGKIFNSKEIDKATDHFNVNRILGQGGQGTVYKGMLTDGRIVAIKKSKAINEGRIEEFINEVAILSQINHRNVVKLLGCCLETEVPLLVYEFIPNGTLFQYLHDHSDEFSLTWEMRLRIASEVAAALFYLHSAASLPIYHRDIKSSNILLDDKYMAKIADFGASKSISIDQTHVTTKVLGTFGYLDPEYFQSSRFTDKSDVYSFGVVLAELLTGKEAISSSGSHDNLVAHFITSMQENKLFEILDPEAVKGEKEDVVTAAELAKRCLNSNGKKRPTMREVASVLEQIRTSHKQTNNFPTSSTFEVVEYVRTDVIEPWDVVSNSTGSTFEITASSGVEPLLN